MSNSNYKNKILRKNTQPLGVIVNYIPEPIRKNVGGFKDKVISLFTTNTPK